MEKKVWGLNSFWLKVIGCLLMTMDHIALLFVSSDPLGSSYTLYYVLRAVGKMAFPIFAFLAVEGVYHTHDIKKYLLRLGVLAILLDAFGFIIGAVTNMSVASNPLIGNVFTDLFLGVLTVYLISKRKWYSFAAVLPIVYAFFTRYYLNDTWGFLFKADWGAFSIVLFVLFALAHEGVTYFLKSRAIQDGLEPDAYLLVDGLKYWKIFASLCLVSTVGIFYLIYRLSNFSVLLPNEFVPIGTYTALAFVFILLYNGQKGYSKKAIRYVFYAYYPFHIVLLGIISLYFGVLATL